jgi:hypothetical protein
MPEETKAEETETEKNKSEEALNEAENLSLSELID